MEVESALVEHEAVAEAAVVGRSPMRDQGGGDRRVRDAPPGERFVATTDLAAELKAHVARAQSAPSRAPTTIVFAADVPKTRSGKIMRRLLRDIAAGKAIGDTTTLADPAVVQSLKERYEAKEG